MTEDEAGQILDWLTGAFGKRLEENERTVWLSTLGDMEAGRAMEIAIQFGKNGDRFPSVPEFRRSVRFVQPDESWRDQSAEALPIPTWVCVWWWSLCTRDDHRAFPQFRPQEKDGMTMAEYEIVRQEWEAAGAPKVGSVRDLIKAME